MNEKIQQLAEQAYDLCNKRTYGSIRSPEEYNQIFASLIIQQCIEIANSQQYPNPISDYAKGFNDGSVFIGLKIIEHFGVKHG